MEGIIIVTYRCNAKCHMCNIWQSPTDPAEELKPEYYRKLPNVKFLNVTGGEPFIREDLEEIVGIMMPKAERICISTNGYYTDRMVALAKKFPSIGMRISLEGLPSANDELRGINDGWDHGIRSLLQLHRLGLKDIGFGITVSDRNAKDLMELYELAEWLGVEFATAVLHNGYYFHKYDNAITKKDEVIAAFEQLIDRQLHHKRLKNWFRAYFNHGIINRVKGNKRLLPCRMGHDIWVVDPFGSVKPCNVLDEVMGNIKEQGFDAIWNSERAKEVRKMVDCCKEECWMVGSASPAMKRDIMVPIKWIIRNKWLRRGEYKECEECEGKAESKAA